MRRGTAQQWMEPHVSAGRLFTVKIEGLVLVLVLGSLFGSAFEPSDAWVVT
jgi:hypothetical protein